MRFARWPLAVAGLLLFGAGLSLLVLVARRPAAAPPPAMATQVSEAVATPTRSVMPALESTPGSALAAAAEAIPAEVEPARRAVVNTHVVADGESLRVIAAQYGVSVETVVSANSLRDPDLLTVGKELVVPAVDGVLHTVAQGETLMVIARSYGVEVPALVEANDLGATPDVLTVGTVLVVPGVRGMVRAPDSAPVAAAPAEPAAQSQSAASTEQRIAEATPLRPSTYTVREGDTLRGIAQTFGLDIITLVGLNGLSDPDLITPGRTLQVSQPRTVEHEVKAGETLADIAWRYSVSATSLLDVNGITNADRIITGMVLVIPSGQARSADAAPKPAAPARAAAATPVPRAPQPTTAARRAAEPTAAPAASTRGERVISARVTGYALGAGAVSNRTASGTQVHWGTVAADTRLFPFGTRLRIEGFPDTVFVVEDRGSAVRGNVFDIWFPDAASARRLGAPTRQVTILP